MFVYLFRNRTSARALTIDVTARNLPSRTGGSHWIFAKRLQIDKSRPRGASLTLTTRSASWTCSATTSWTLKQLVRLRTVAASGRAASDPAGARVIDRAGLRPCFGC